jgi:hypothetical protein
MSQQKSAPKSATPMNQMYAELWSRVWMTTARRADSAMRGVHRHPLSFTIERFGIIPAREEKRVRLTR